MMLVLQCQGAFRDVAEMEDIEIGLCSTSGREATACISMGLLCVCAFELLQPVVLHGASNTGQASPRTTIQRMCQPQEAVQP